MLSAICLRKQTSHGGKPGRILESRMIFGRETLSSEWIGAWADIWMSRKITSLANCFRRKKFLFPGARRRRICAKVHSSTLVMMEQNYGCGNSGLLAS